MKYRGMFWRNLYWLCDEDPIEWDVQKIALVGVGI